MAIQEGGQFSPDNRIVSPGVFTRENDLSGIAQGVADIGGVIVAPFPKGPGFAPTLVRSVADLQNQFGVPDGTYYGPYTAAEYLTERGLVTVCRVGALTGYKQNYPFVIWAQKGVWNRNISNGALVSGSSYLTFSGSLASNYSESVAIGAPTTSLVITSASLTITFASEAADVGAGNSNLSTSGSILYYGQTITLGIPTTTLTAISFYTG